MVEKWPHTTGDVTSALFTRGALSVKYAVDGRTKYFVYSRAAPCREQGWSSQMDSHNQDGVVALDPGNLPGTSKGLEQV